MPPIHPDLTAHTPGPWTVFKPVSVRVPGIDSGLASIVLCSDGDDDAGVRGRTDAEVWANAHLIAASPDLLDALERLVKPAPGVKKLPPWAIGIARVAIAKATAPSTVGGR